MSRVYIQVPAPVGVPLSSRHRADPFGSDKEGDATHWVTSEERRVKIRAMTDTHLLNAIRMMVRATPRDFEAELHTIGAALSMFSGESMAAYYAEQELDRLLEYGPENSLEENPVYTGLRKEAERRGLKWEP
jgi:ABC-type ATPase with predicted acetyltransferase domain